MFNRYYQIALPTYLGFFAGKRFVPIVTALAAIVLGALLSVIWPPDAVRHQRVLALGRGQRSAHRRDRLRLRRTPADPVRPAPHLERARSSSRSARFTDATGKVVHGDINRFFAGDPTAGILAGAFLFKMFGLPAAAIAMWHERQAREQGSRSAAS